MNDPKAQQWLTRADGLATRLRQIRTRAGRSGLSLATALGWQSSKVTRIESGEQGPKVTDVEAWARECGASDTEVNELLELLRQYQSVRSMLRQRARNGTTPAQTDSSALIEASTLIRTYSLNALPVVLQLPEYAKAVIEEGERTLGDGPQIAEAVDARMRRAALLQDRTRRFEMILDESVLYRRRGGEVMHSQLDRLLPLGSASNVRFGIIPFTRQVEVPAIQGFAVYDDAAVLETYRGDQRVADEQLPFYTGLLEDMWSSAVEGRDARLLVVQAIDALGR